MVRGDHRFQAGLLEVLPPRSRRIDAVKVAHHLPVVEARVADVQLALSRHTLLAPGAPTSQPVHSGSGRPRRNSSAYSLNIAAALSGSGISSPLALAFARPHTISKNASVLSAGRVCQTARARPGPAFHIACGVPAGPSTVSPAPIA